MLELTLDNLIQLLSQNGYQAHLQKETNQVYTVFSFEDREYPLFLRIFDHAYQLQLMVFLPSHLQAQSDQNPHGTPSPIDVDSPYGKIISSLSRMLHLVNKELDIPGFGMDEKAGVVFYRVIIPSMHKCIDPQLILNYIKGAEQICKLFGMPIEAVSTGEATLDDLLKKAKEQGH